MFRFFLIFLLGWSQVLFAQSGNMITPWGDPSLEGLWSNETLTPFERNASSSEKEYVTEEEADAMAARKAKALALDAAPRTTEFAPPKKGGDVGGYNLAWLDNGSRVVSTMRSSQIISPRNGRVPVKESALRKRDDIYKKSFDDPEAMSVWDRCITRGIPGSMLPAGYNNYYRIVQRPEAVLIYYEMIHEARYIPLTKTPRLDHVDFWNGQPRGYWEDQTLVVETLGFNDKGWIATSFSQGRIKGVAHTGQLSVIERFKRHDSDTILWSATVSDPEVYHSKWTVEIPLEARADQKIFEYACHEGNQAVGNILRGARVQQQILN